MPPTVPEPLHLAEFDYELPPGAIAQRPSAQRDEARLMVVEGDVTARPLCDDRSIHDLPELLRPGDLLVVNDTRVFPARLTGHKETGGRIEALLTAPDSDDVSGRQRWKAILGASRMPGAGSAIVFGSGFAAVVIQPPGAGGEAAILELRADGGVEAAIERFGQVPLPPYIARGDGPEAEDRGRYQTIFARERGAAAAPTAGLHFTPELVARLESAGIARAAVTLHVGPGTFQPLRDGPLPDRLHAEFYRIPEATVEAIHRTRRSGGSVVAVGTTTVRTLEHAGRDGRLCPGEGWCDLFIRPGFAFRQTDRMLTNFHLPRSSLLVLVAAFAGRDRILAAYREAIERGYRFYSYGDATLLDPWPPRSHP